MPDTFPLPSLANWHAQRPWDEPDFVFIAPEPGAVHVLSLIEAERRLQRPLFHRYLVGDIFGIQLDAFGRNTPKMIDAALRFNAGFRYRALFTLADLISQVEAAGHPCLLYCGGFHPDQPSPDSSSNPLPVRGNLRDWTRRFLLHDGSFERTLWDCVRNIIVNGEPIAPLCIDGLGGADVPGPSRPLTSCLMVRAAVALLKSWGFTILTEARPEPSSTFTLYSSLTTSDFAQYELDHGEGRGLPELGYARNFDAILTSPSTRSEVGTWGRAGYDIFIGAPDLAIDPVTNLPLYPTYWPQPGAAP